MNQHLQKILDYIEQSEQFSEADKNALTKAAKDTDRDLTISEFKLERTEKIKRTTATLLEETIEELEKKREAVEAQNKELEIEAALERMRAVALTIRTSDELIKVAESLYNELLILGFSNTRNAQVVINLGENELYLICVYTEGSAEIFKESRYETSPIIQNLYDELDASHDALYQKEIIGKDFEDWMEWRKTTISNFDEKLLKARSVCFYLYSIGEGHLGISTYNSITEAQLEILKRFRNVFELAYRRFMDIAKAEEQAENLRKEKETLEKTLTELQETQKQLIQSEKMASLGELTAGIAHEIQNPLNFVNNFSEVSKELLQEMLDELAKGDTEEVNFIAKDVIQNLEKINHHGKRADGIVKGMLQHSRSNSGEKAAVDINVLVDEYLRLAYHGLRAKDKSFNATIQTDYDTSIGKIEIVPQDIGRVILNVITNAFYACTERSRSAHADNNLRNASKINSVIKEKEYVPTVSISTSPLEGGKAGVAISVKDNGTGMPKHVVDKIFQPFFTTKPTGQGTGLGLSLSYDIVKAHGGDLRVSTEQNIGTEFVISIPITP